MNLPQISLKNKIIQINITILPRKSFHSRSNINILVADYVYHIVWHHPFTVVRNSMYSIPSPGYL